MLVVGWAIRPADLLSSGSSRLERRLQARLPAPPIDCSVPSIRPALEIALLRLQLGEEFFTIDTFTAL